MQVQEDPKITYQSEKGGITPLRTKDEESLDLGKPFNLGRDWDKNVDSTT